MTADQIIAGTKELPVVSETARKLTIQLNQPDLHRDELAKTLRCDNVLTAKLLRVCNSAECGAREPILSIDQALLILGDNMVFRMVCSIGFAGALGFAAPGYASEANGLWIHSLNTGVGAEYLAGVELFNDFPSATAFTAGLLHDIGKTVINQVLTPRDRAAIRNKIAEQSLSRIEAEKAVLGADHCEVGACLLKKWALPETIVEAVANHHAPVIKPAIQLSALVYLANSAAHFSNTAPGWETSLMESNIASAKALGLDVKKVEQIVAAMMAAA
jgi:putative nucleotidyltransferase with HDIG domain